jgi:hypothetical protein
MKGKEQRMGGRRLCEGQRQGWCRGESMVEVGRRHTGQPKPFKGQVQDRCRE